MTFNEAKSRIMSALTQFPDETDVPKVTSTDDFEICVGRLRKLDGTPGEGPPKLEFEIIDGEKRMRDVYNKPWETGYLKFKNSDGTSLESSMSLCYVPRVVLGARLILELPY
jgi:hypothetical protein